ncbi:hypothetical protein [Brevibacillus migulae]|uniref:hypothetical protein n=1 Tax=Brevibacillus migulae TaxID=1644114 RepID=UPI00106EF6F2|nr:hypothetical protein [Brevibacillus migulae]
MTDPLYYEDIDARVAAVKAKINSVQEQSADVFDIDENEYKLFQTNEFLAKNTGLTVDASAKFRIAMRDVIKKGDSKPGIYLNNDKEQAIVVTKSKDNEYKMFKFKIESDNTWTLVDSETEKSSK